MGKQVRAIICVVASLAIVSACGPAQKTPAPAVSAQSPEAEKQSEERSDLRPTVVMLGDSLTAGFGLETEQALPDQVEAALRARGVAASFVNAGVSGDTTRGGLERYDWSVKGAKADILVIALGANDFLSGLPANQAEANLDAIIERAKSDGLRVALLGVGLRGSTAQDAREEAYAAVYRNLAEKHQVSMFPDMLAALAGRRDLLLEDGLHPTASGVAAMAASMSDFLSNEIAAWSAAN